MFEQRRNQPNKLFLRGFCRVFLSSFSRKTADFCKFSLFYIVTCSEYLIAKVVSVSAISHIWCSACRKSRLWFHVSGMAGCLVAKCGSCQLSLGYGRVRWVFPFFHEIPTWHREGVPILGIAWMSKSIGVALASACNRRGVRHHLYQVRTHTHTAFILHTPSVTYIIIPNYTVCTHNTMVSWWENVTLSFLLLFLSSRSEIWDSSTSHNSRCDQFSSICCIRVFRMWAVSLC